MSASVTRTSPAAAAPTFIVGVVLASLVVAPFAMILYVALIDGDPVLGGGSWTLANFTSLFTPRLGRAIVNTVIVCFGGAALAMPIGGGLAWLAMRTNVPGRGFIHVAGIMPLFLSLLVAAVTWSLLGAGRSGYLNIIMDWLGLPVRLEVQSLAGIIFIHGLYYAPYPFLFVSGALSLMNAELEEAAAVHGGSASQALHRVVFPLVRPALVGSFLLIIVLMAEDFPVPQVLGASVGIETLSISVYNAMSQAPSLPNKAAAISVLLTAIVGVLVYAQRRTLAGRDYRTLTGKGARASLVRLGIWRWPAFAFAFLYAFLAMGLPMLALLQGSLRSNLYIPNATALFDVSKFGLTHIQVALNSPLLWTSLGNTVLLAVTTSLVGVLLFFTTAYIVERTNAPGRRYLEYFAMIPVALPAMVMALGVMWIWVQIPVPVYGTLVILVLAFLVRFLPQGYRAVSSSIQQVHEDLEHAAMVCGASRLHVARTITLPLVRSGVLGAGLLMVVLTFREVTASLLLYTSETRTLSIIIYEAYVNGNWTSVSALSLVYTIMLIVITVISRRWMGGNA